MAKIDLKKEERRFYNSSKKDFEVVDVPPMTFLMIDGEGDPNTSQAYREALEALYPVAYAAKFISKRDLGTDYVVMPLEGLWWAENLADFSLGRKDTWLWTVMIRQPDHLTETIIRRAMEEAAKKKKPAALPNMRFETYHEGLAMQIMYIGPYSDEAPTIAQMHEHIEANGYLLGGKHHEIYLSDPRRTAPEKLKTIIRQPIKRA